jgi:hypothetical protein
VIYLAFKDIAMGEYEYYIDTKEIFPPIGRTLKYAGFVHFMFYDDGKEKTRIKHDFGETYGRTVEDATEKMEEKVQKWIKSQKSA